MARVSSGRRVAVIVCAFALGTGLVSLGAKAMQPGGWDHWFGQSGRPGPTREELSADRFYAQALGRLPAGAFDIESRGRTHTHGWFLFSLSDNGKTSRYLVYYRSGDGGGIQYAITRAD